MTESQLSSISRRNMLRRLALAGIAVPTLPAVLAACGDDSDSTSSSKSDASDGAPNLKGKLNFVNFTDWVGAGTYAAFAAKYPGASVNEVPFQSNEDTIAKAKDRAGDIDLVLVDGTTFPSLEAIDALADFGDAVPNSKFIAKEFTGRSWDPKDTRFAATDYGRTGIAYRSDLITEQPTSWSDFYDIMEKYKGKVGLLDYQRSVMGTVLTSLGLDPSSKEQADLDKVSEQLAKIKPNLLAIATEPGKQLASGDLAIAWADAYDVFTAQQENPNIVWVDPSEGQVAYLEGLAVLKGPREDLARAFVDFHLDPPQYADFINTVNTAGVQPTNDKIKPELLSNPVLNPSDEVRSKIVFHDSLGDAEELWQTTWDGFKAA